MIHVKYIVSGKQKVSKRTENFSTFLNQRKPITTILEASFVHIAHYVRYVLTNLLAF